MVIERRAKEGHSQPRMFVFPRVLFDEALYADTVFTAELLWMPDANPQILIHDLIADRGVNARGMSFLDRYKAIQFLLEHMYDHVPGYSTAQVLLKPLFGMAQKHDACGKVTYPAKGVEYRVPGDIAWFQGGSLAPPIASSRETNASSPEECRLQRTDLPDVIEVFRGSEFLGYATVPTMRDSLYLGKALLDNPAGIRLPCEWNTRWKAWQPIIPVAE